MANRFFLLPYRKGSSSVRSLIMELEEEFKLIKLENSKYRYRAGDVVLNWGNSTTNVDFPTTATILNHPYKIREVSNKLRFFQMMNSLTDAPRMPPFTTEQEEARGWLEDGHVVFVRTKLTGHSGEGIVVLENVGDEARFGNGSLFVKYIKKKEEYRIHFMNGRIFDSQRKARRVDAPEPNFMIRSHKNGFVYARNDLAIPADVQTQAQKVVDSGVLDFGAIDVIYNKLYKQAYVLEVNTSPGLEGTTLINYVTEINAWVNNNKP